MQPARAACLHSILLYCDMTPECRNNGARGDFFARQRVGKHVPAEMNAYATRF
jgi:hypothetical protein